MAAPTVTVNVMLAIHEKKTSSIDLYKPLRQYIVVHYSERDAHDMEEDLQAVKNMRNEVEKASDSLDARRDLLQNYYKALCVMESRFPISTEKEHVHTVSFTWHDAFKQSKKATQQNIHLEKAAILFNLAAIQSQIALSADRTSANGLKQACNSFQAAAGAFAFLRDNVSMKASVGQATLDISVECAGMLERLMLAQAQECFFEKVISDGKPSSLCAKVARQVSLYYEEAYAALNLPPLNQHFDRTWIAHVHLKAAQFYAEACFRLSLELHEKEEIAEEIARLKAGITTLSDAKKSARGVVGPLLEAVSKLEGNINRNLERATKENDRVYLMRVPAVNSLPPLPTASLVKSMPMQEFLDASKEKMFVQLVPDSSAKALSKYTEMVDDVIRVQAEKLQQESEIMRVKLKEMDLPDSLLALEGNSTLPDQLKEDVEAVQASGGPSGLEAEMQQLRDLRRENQELLVQTEELLQKEAREDAQFRAQFGTRWTRPQSSTITKSLQDRLNRFAGNLKQATDSDARIERAIRDNYSLMEILDRQPIEAALPSLGRPIMSLDGNEDAIVGALKNSLRQLEMLGSRRAGLEDMLKEMKQKDNILPKLMATSGSYEDLFKKELAKYDPVCAEVARNVELQEQLLQQIQAQNKDFAAVFNLEDYKGRGIKMYLGTIGELQSHYIMIVFLVKDLVYLVCISLTKEPLQALKGQLELLYSQMLLILTKSVEKCFEKNAKFDMRSLLGGTNVVFSSLIHAFSWNPATFLHAYTCLPLSYATRQAANASLQDIVDSKVIFAMLMCKHKVISIAAVQKATLHPDDILLLSNFVASSDSFRTSESFSPICLPQYNPMTFLYAYVQYLEGDTFLMLLTTESNTFFHLRECRIHIEMVLNKSNVLNEVKTSMLDNGLHVENLPGDMTLHPEYVHGYQRQDKEQEPTVARKGVKTSSTVLGGAAGLWHFIYRSTYLDQYVASEFSPPLNTRRAEKRLLRAYQNLYASMHHGVIGPHKMQYRRDENYILLCWITQDFELYAAFDPLAEKSLAVTVCNRVCHWLRDVETEIFLLDASPFLW